MKTVLRALGLAMAGCLGSAQAQPPLEGEKEVTLAFAHDYILPNEKGQVHLLPETRVEFDTLGTVRRFSDQGEVSWKQSVGHAGNDGIIAWGRWGTGSISGSGNHGSHEITGGEGARNGLYYVAGQPTEAQAANAESVVQYALLGGEVAPSAGEGGMAATTSLVDGALTVDRKKGLVDMDLTVIVPSGTYQIKARDLRLEGTTFSSNADSAVEVDGAFCFAGCWLEMKGFLAGPNAERAGFAYQIGVEALSQDPNGVVAWTSNN